MMYQHIWGTEELEIYTMFKRLCVCVFKMINVHVLTYIPWLKSNRKWEDPGKMFPYLHYIWI